MKTVKAACMIRKHECVLAQIVRRLFEEETNLILLNQIETGKTVLKGGAFAGEVVVSTDLESRGRGGRNKQKKRNAEAAEFAFASTLVILILKVRL